MVKGDCAGCTCAGLDLQNALLGRVLLEGTGEGSLDGIKNPLRVGRRDILR